MKVLTLSPLTSLILRVVGILLILSYLLDVAVLLIGANFQDNQWILTLTSQLVDRGFIPMLAIALLFVSTWIEEASTSDGPRGRGLRLTVLWLASVLALMFLLIIPLHINTTRAAADAQITQINQEADGAQKQLDSQVQQVKGQLDARLSVLDQAIKSNQLSSEQLAQAQREQQQLQKLKSDPKALESQVGPSRAQAQKQISDRRQQLESQTRANALRSGMRIGLLSLLLAIGYAIVGWFGLRQLL